MLCFSGDSTQGNVTCTSNEIFGMEGGIYALHGEELTMYSLCLHHQQCTRTTPKESWGFCGWWPENTSTDNSISLTCFHLTFASGCWLGWAQHVCGRQCTSCPVQTATALLARADPGKISSFIPFLSTPNTPHLHQLPGHRILQIPVFNRPFYLSHIEKWHWKK